MSNEFEVNREGTGVSTLRGDGTDGNQGSGVTSLSGDGTTTDTQQQQEGPVVNQKPATASTVYDPEDMSEHPHQHNINAMHGLIKDLMLAKNYISKEVHALETWTLDHFNAFKSMMAHEYGDVVGNVPMTEAQVHPRMQIDPDWGGENFQETEETESGEVVVKSLTLAGSPYAPANPVVEAGAPGARVLTGGDPKADAEAQPVSRVATLTDTTVPAVAPDPSKTVDEGETTQSTATDPVTAAPEGEAPAPTAKEYVAMAPPEVVMAPPVDQQQPSATSVTDTPAEEVKKDGE